MWTICTKLSNIWRTGTLSFHMSLTKLWRIEIECKMQQIGGGGGAFYQCEEYARMLYKFWLLHFFHKVWDIGTKYVAYVYQFFTWCEELLPILHSVKFTKCEICGSTKLPKVRSIPIGYMYRRPNDWSFKINPDRPALPIWVTVTLFDRTYLSKKIRVNTTILLSYLFNYLSTDNFLNFFQISSNFYKQQEQTMPVRLALKAPIATKVVCFSRLLKCLRSL